MAKYSFLIFAWVLLQNMLIGQTQTDSLRTVVKTGDNSQKIEALLELSTIYTGIDLDTSMQYANQAMHLSIETNNQEKLAKALKKKGVAYYYTSKVDSSLANFRRSLTIYRNLEMEQEAAGLLANIGIIQTDRSNYDQALEDLTTAKAIYEEINDSTGICTVLGSIGAIYLSVSSYDKALDYFQRSHDIAIKANDQFSILSSIHNMGLVYHNWGQFEKAVEQYQKALKLAHDRNDKRTIAHINLNIGVVYYDWEDYEKALEYYGKALKVNEELGDLPNMTHVLNNMAIIYEKSQQKDKALEHYTKALNIAKKAERQRSVAIAYLNIGNFYNGLKEYKKARHYYVKSLDIREAINDQKGIASSLISLGNVYSDQKQYTKAIDYYNSGVAILNELKHTPDLKEAYGAISETYKEMGNYKKALEYFDQYTALKDSMFNKEAHKNITDIQTKYETEKKEKEIELLNKGKQLDKLKMREQNEAIQKQRILIISFIIVFILILIFSFIVYRLYSRIRTANKVLARQNTEIREQKEEIESQRDDITYKNAELEQKNEEITAQRDEIEKQRDMVMQQKEHIEAIHLEVSQSIDYALRIQQAVLPQPDILASRGIDHFIVFKPRDKVSGDFYWWTTLEDYTIITAADCTGHGVPGAFMSLLGISFLREIVMKEYITHPGVILRRLRKEIVKSLSQTGAEGTQKDGMDMSLLVINHQEKTLSWAGANNPLWIVRANRTVKHDDIAEDIEVIKADKMPIGIYERMDKFQNHELKLAPEDRVYMFSDGFPDQFGGPKGKKFKQKAFKRLIAQTAHLSMVEQGVYVENELEKWMHHDGEDYEQVDDITLLGLSVTFK